MAMVPLKLNKLKPDRLLFAAANDDVTMKQVLATHSPDGREFSVRPLLDITQDMNNRASLSIPVQTLETPKSVEEGAPLLDAIDIKRNESNIILRLCCEYKCCGEADVHEETLVLFDLLTSYAWDAKVVLALAAFAITYGEFALLVEYKKTSPLAAAISILKILPQILENIDMLKQNFFVINDLIKALTVVANCILEFKLLPSQYINLETPEIKSAANVIPSAVYWSIRIIVICARQITSLSGIGHLYNVATTEAWELSSLAYKVDNIRKHLQQLLAACHRHIDEKRHHDTFQTLVHLFEIPHIDNNKILRALIYSKDDQLPLIHCSTKTKANLDVLRKKQVMLLISKLELPAMELSMLDQIYQDSIENQDRAESDYEVVWLPIVDKSTHGTEEKQKRDFEEILDLMSWYSVSHPSLIDSAVIRYIKEVWHFDKKPLLVVLDPQGKVVNPNGLHMLWIWGSLAYPFTRSREDALWKDESWRLELLVDIIEPLILNWIAKEKYICIYGGEDLTWIKKFIQKAKEVAEAANIELEMLYVGKSKPGEKIRTNITTILTENLSHALPDPALMLFFWVRIESMWHSKIQCGKSIEDDPIMQEIMTILSFDSSDQGWALFSKGSSTDLVRSKAETISQCFNEYDQWLDMANREGFMPALKKQLQDLHTPHHCSRLILPSSNGTIPEKVVCVECGRPMEKFAMYRCCMD